MKTYILNNLPIVAALASFALIPISTVAAGMAFTVSGVVAMLLADYGRNITPVTANPVHATELADAPLAA